MPRRTADSTWGPPWASSAPGNGSERGQQPARRSSATVGRAWVAAAFAVFAVFAGGVALISGVGTHRRWAVAAAAGYLLAAVAAAAWKDRGVDLALLAGLCGALLVPLGWMVVSGEAQREVRVIARSAALFVHHGTPYPSVAALAGTHNPDAYNPYLPAMSLFGMVRALLGSTPLTDPRIWFGLAFVVLFSLALVVAGAPDILRWTVFLTATPVIAFPLATGGDDLPVLALMCLGLALLWRRSSPQHQRPPRYQYQAHPVLAGVAFGVAAAMKATAWPALPVAFALLAARDGRRTASRFAVTVLGVFAAFVGPVAVVSPGALLVNTISFPLGLASVKSAAASQLPGYLLSQTGHVGHLVAVGLFALVSLAFTASLVIRPPRDVPAAARRLILGLVLMFALAPSTRFGYYLYPAGLWLWLKVSSLGSDGPPAEPGQAPGFTGP